MDSRKEQEWKKFKEEAIQRLLRDKDIGYLDPDIWDLLDAFMKRDKAFTYSSCSGRITIIDAIYPWARKDSSVIYKNHLVLSEDELEGVLEKGQIRRLCLSFKVPFSTFTPWIATRRGQFLESREVWGSSTVGYLPRIRREFS